MPIKRDRTEDLHSLFRSCRVKSNALHSKDVLHSSNGMKKFSHFAQAFSDDIANVSSLILRLTEVSSHQSVFDGQTTAGLTQIVTASLQKLHRDLSVLEELKASVLLTNENRLPKACPTHQSEDHNEKVVQSLKGKLARTGQDFRSALNQQAKTIKSNTNRRHLFSNNEHPQSLETALSHDMEQYQSQHQLVAGRNSLQYAQQRVEDVMQIEAAVTEVSQLFNDFTRLVQEQDDVVVRIDANVDDALRHVNAGSNELMRYLSNISSNRGLILKILGFLFVFLLFFGLVVVHYFATFSFLLHLDCNVGASMDIFFFFC